MSAVTGRDRAALRGEAHHLQPLVHVGASGLTPAVFNALDEVLQARELVKVQIGRHVDAPPRDTAQALALATSSSVIQVIGRTATLYRENPELPRKSGSLPPWRRQGG